MIVYHSTTDQHGKLYHTALVNDVVIIPYHKDKDYVEKRAKHFEDNLKDENYRVQTETFRI